MLMLALEPDELASRYGLYFEEGNDTLDKFQRAVVMLDKDHQAWLMRHEHNPVSGTVMFVDAKSDFRASIVRLQKLLDLPPDDIRWRVTDEQ